MSGRACMMVGVVVCLIPGYVLFKVRKLGEEEVQRHLDGRLVESSRLCSLLHPAAHPEQPGDILLGLSEQKLVSRWEVSCRLPDGKEVATLLWMGAGDLRGIVVDEDGLDDTTVQPLFFGAIRTAQKAKSVALGWITYLGLAADQHWHPTKVERVASRHWQVLLQANSEDLTLILRDRDSQLIRLSRTRDRQEYRR